MAMSFSEVFTRIFMVWWLIGFLASLGHFNLIWFQVAEGMNSNKAQHRISIGIATSIIVMFVYGLLGPMSFLILSHMKRGGK